MKAWQTSAWRLGKQAMLVFCVRSWVCWNLFGEGDLCESSTEKRRNTQQQSRVHRHYDGWHERQAALIFRGAKGIKGIWWRRLYHFPVQARPKGVALNENDNAKTSSLNEPIVLWD